MNLSYERLQSFSLDTIHLCSLGSSFPELGSKGLFANTQEQPGGPRSGSDDENGNL
jgi:hypothetical protein